MTSEALPIAATVDQRRAGWLPRAEALAWALGLSALFFLVYGGCNAVTAIRTDVGQAYFAWELRIPLIPAMILPYMSIDLFFFFAPFLCTDRRELRSHGLRVALAMLIAGACFVLFPLTAGFVRQPVHGVFGPIFDLLRGFDRPYNLAPSLHIALWTLLLTVYVRHTRGLLRAAVIIWFGLIAVSTVLTHQHHLIDVATGYLLGVLCLRIRPDEATHGVRDARLALRYASGALAFLVLGYLLRPWGLILLWGVFALTALAAGYAGTGPVIFGKRDGRIPWPTRILLAPYYAGAWLSFVCYTRSAQPWAEVAPGLLIGRKPSAREADELIKLGVTAVLDLTAEYSETPRLRGLAYLNIPVLDLTAPSTQQLSQAVRFVGRHLGQGKVYVHCALGYSRSAGVAAAYLLSAGLSGSAAEACDAVRRCRPRAVIRESALVQG